MMMCNIIQNDIREILESFDVEQCRNKTFLISGANGALARYLVFTLMELKQRYGDDYCTVLVICRNRERAESVFENYLGNKGFLLFIQQVEERLNYKGKIDFIIHAAGNSATKLFSHYPVETATANIIGGYELLELAREKNVKGFLYFSSGAVYGDSDTLTKNTVETEYYPIDPFGTDSCYSLSKKMTECLCMAYYREYNVPVKMVRIAHTYGPGINLNDGHVYSDFIKSIIRGEDLIIHGNGQDRRAFCYITDAIAAFFKILFQGGPGESYNMANNENFLSIKELAELLCKEVVQESNLNLHIHLPETNKLPQYSIDTKKLEHLGWIPRISVKEGFLRTISYFKEYYD